MGLFTKKKKTVVDQTQTANTSGTSTPIIPDWISNPLQQLSGKVGSTFGGFDPTKYVAGPDALQTQAAGAAGNLGTPSGFKTANDILSGVAGAGAQTVQAGDIASLIGKFQNPYERQVKDAALEDYDFGAGQVGAQDQLSRAGDTTFGGSGGAIQTALSNARLTAGRGKLSADILSDGFKTASGLATSQAGLNSQASRDNANFAESALARQLSAGGQIGNLGIAQGENDRSNIGLQFDLGEGLRGIQTAQNQAPLDLLLAEIAARSGLNPDLFKGMSTTGNATETLKGTTTTKSSGISMSDIAKIAQAAATAAAASDVRLKQDIEHVETDAKGRRWYEFAYVWDPETRHRGVMAQEVRVTDPEAVFQHPMGFLMVDYAKLEDA